MTTIINKDAQVNKSIWIPISDNLDLKDEVTYQKRHGQPEANEKSLVPELIHEALEARKAKRKK